MIIEIVGSDKKKKINRAKLGIIIMEGEGGLKSTCPTYILYLINTFNGQSLTYDHMYHESVPCTM